MEELITKEETTLIDGAGSEGDIKARTAQIHAQAATAAAWTR